MSILTVARQLIEAKRNNLAGNQRPAMTHFQAMLGTGPHKYSSTQIQVPENVAEVASGFAESIPDYELAGDGRENDFHITVKYGLHIQNPRRVSDAIAGIGPIRVRLGKTSIFPAKESSTQRGGDVYDVVKVDVDSPDLHRLNKIVSNAVPHTDTFPKYSPHMTIAYVKPGDGQKYVGSNDFDGIEFVVDEIVFSAADGTRFTLPLKTEPLDATLGTRYSSIIDAIPEEYEDEPVWEAIETAMIGGIRESDCEQLREAARWAESFAEDLEFRELNDTDDESARHDTIAAARNIATLATEAIDRIEFSHKPIATLATAPVKTASPPATTDHETMLIAYLDALVDAEAGTDPHAHEVADELWGMMHPEQGGDGVEPEGSNGTLSTVTDVVTLKTPDSEHDFSGKSDVGSFWEKLTRPRGIKPEHLHAMAKQKHAESGGKLSPKEAYREAADELEPDKETGITRKKNQPAPSTQSAPIAPQAKQTADQAASHPASGNAPKPTATLPAAPKLQRSDVLNKKGNAGAPLNAPAPSASQSPGASAPSAPSAADGKAPPIKLANGQLSPTGSGFKIKSDHAYWDPVKQKFIYGSAHSPKMGPHPDAGVHLGEKAGKLTSKITAHAQDPAKNPKPTEQDYQDLFAELPNLDMKQRVAIRNQVLASFGANAGQRETFANALRAHIKQRIIAAGGHGNDPFVKATGSIFSKDNIQLERKSGKTEQLAPQQASATSQTPQEQKGASPASPLPSPEVVNAAKQKGKAATPHPNTDHNTDENAKVAQPKIGSFEQQGGKLPWQMTPDEFKQSGLKIFKTSAGSMYAVHPKTGSTIRIKSDHSQLGHDVKDKGIKDPSAKTVYVPNGAGSSLSSAGLTGPDGKPPKSRLLIKDGKATLLIWNQMANGGKGAWGSTKSGTGVPISDKPGIGMSPLELWKRDPDHDGNEVYRNMHAGNAITSIDDPSDEHHKAFMEAAKAAGKEVGHPAPSSVPEAATPQPPAPDDEPVTVPSLEGTERENAPIKREDDAASPSKPFGPLPANAPTLRDQHDIPKSQDTGKGGEVAVDKPLPNERSEDDRRQARVEELLDKKRSGQELTMNEHKELSGLLNELPENRHHAFIDQLGLDSEGGSEGHKQKILNETNPNRLKVSHSQKVANHLMKEAENRYLNDSEARHLYNALKESKKPDGSSYSESEINKIMDDAVMEWHPPAKQSNDTLPTKSDHSGPPPKTAQEHAPAKSEPVTTRVPGPAVPPPPNALGASVAAPEDKVTAPEEKKAEPESGGKAPLTPEQKAAYRASIYARGKKVIVLDGKGGERVGFVSKTPDENGNVVVRFPDGTKNGTKETHDVNMVISAKKPKLMPEPKVKQEKPPKPEKPAKAEKPATETPEEDKGGIFSDEMKPEEGGGDVGLTDEERSAGYQEKAKYIANEVAKGTKLGQKFIREFAEEYRAQQNSMHDFEGLKALLATVNPTTRGKMNRREGYHDTDAENLEIHAREAYANPRFRHFFVDPEVGSNPSLHDQLTAIIRNFDGKWPRKPMTLKQAVAHIKDEFKAAEEERKNKQWLDEKESKLEEERKNAESHSSPEEIDAALRSSEDSVRSEAEAREALAADEGVGEADGRGESWEPEAVGDDSFDFDPSSFGDVEPANEPEPEPPAPAPTNRLGGTQIFPGMTKPRKWSHAEGDKGHPSGRHYAKEAIAIGIDPEDVHERAKSIYDASPDPYRPITQEKAYKQAFAELEQEKKDADEADKQTGNDLGEQQGDEGERGAVNAGGGGSDELGEKIGTESSVQAPAANAEAKASEKNPAVPSPSPEESVAAAIREHHKHWPNGLHVDDIAALRKRFPEMTNRQIRAIAEEMLHRGSGEVAEPANGKEPWEMTNIEFAKSKLPPKVSSQVNQFQPSYAGQHQKEIAAALAAGKPVPPEVLADYPELVKANVPQGAQVKVFDQSQTRVPVGDAIRMGEEEFKKKKRRRKK